MKILIIEDDDSIINLYKNQLSNHIHGEKIKYIFAKTTQESREKFYGNKDVSVIVVDGCILGSKERPNTTELVKEFRKSFSGHMIAASGRQDYRDLLVEAGCNDSHDKLEVHKKIAKLLDEFYGKK